jgi:hypothetical protein
MEIGVCPEEQWMQIQNGSNGEARTLGYVFSRAGGSGQGFPAQAWTIHGGYKAGEEVQMRLDLEKRTLSVLKYPQGTVLGTCTQIPKKVVPFLSMGPFNVQVTFK